MRKTMKELVQVEQTVEKIYCNICGKHIQNIIDSEYFEDFDVGYFQVNTCINNITKYYKTIDICFTCAEKLENDLSQIIGKCEIIKK